MIEEIADTVGQRVTAGDVLFRLDAKTYEAAFAEAVRDSAETTLITAQAKASVKRAEADLKQAQLNLSRVDIHSLISGISDAPEFSSGSPVIANHSDALTTVTRLEQIYVDVSESSARLMRIRGPLTGGLAILASKTLRFCARSTASSEKETDIDTAKS
ncbi:efflux RND transporter periplasmic adaptor subunit [Celeribacter sp. ULVN23_4]